MLRWLLLPAIIYAVSVYWPAAVRPDAAVALRPGQILAHAPQRVEVSTNTAVHPGTRLRIEVFGPDRTRVDDGITMAGGADRSQFSVGLVGNLKPGRYLVDAQTDVATRQSLDQPQFAFYLQTQPTRQEEALDRGMARARTTEDRDEPYPLSELLVAVGAGFGAAIGCVGTGLGLLWLLCRRRRGFGLPEETTNRNVEVAYADCAPLWWDTWQWC